ncbi:type I restriction endonuclease [Muribaculaceae bacterium Isolate-113 (HZI)]|nr:type I restriction endonuclease [Muribaculaceae bacterium Isolate-113 (HZI)]
MALLPSASYKSHYQNFTPPFDIPDSWQWVRLGDIVEEPKYGTSSKSLSKGRIPVLRMGNITKDGKVEYSNLVYSDNESEIIEYQLKKGDILFNRTNSSEWVGKSALYDGELGAIYAGYLVRVRPIMILSEYLILVMTSSYYRNWCHLVKTDAVNQSNINAQKLKSFMLPLPPLKEQRRIYDNFLKLSVLVKNISDSCNKLSDMINLTKNKILDLAMQGKLVPQDPADEPGAYMLRRINPKAKIITDNPHYPQLPDNWVLTRIKDVFEINPKNKAADNIQAGFVPMALIHDGYSDKFHYDVRQWGEIKSGFTHFADGDIAVAKISPCLENRKSMILRDLPNGIGAGTTELLIFRSTILIPEFSLLFFKSDNFIKCCTGTFNGVVGQQRVGKSIVEDIHIPIPPLNTQRAIVQRVQDWFDCFDNIFAGISNERDSLI